MTSTCIICAKPLTARQMKRGGRACGASGCAQRAAWNVRGRDTIEERYWKYVDKTPGQGPEGDCWGWTASTDQAGYGQLGVKGEGKIKRAHVLSYEIHYGPVPEGLEVCHDCHNRPCSNPAHLIADTHQENLHQTIIRKAIAKEVSISLVAPADLTVYPFDKINQDVDRPKVHELLANILNELTQQEKKVIIWRYGLFGEPTKTYKEIGPHFNCTGENIRQVEARALARLRHSAISRDLRAALAA